MRDNHIMYIKSGNTFGKRGLLLLVYHTLCEK